MTLPKSRDWILNHHPSTIVLGNPLQPFQTSHRLFVLSWSLTLNVVPEACGIWAVVLVFFFCYISENCIFWPWDKFTETLTPGKTGSCAACFLFVNYFSHCTNDGLQIVCIVCSTPANCQTFCFYRGARTRWGSINQVHLISSTWLLLTALIPKYLLLSFSLHSTESHKNSFSHAVPCKLWYE